MLNSNQVSKQWKLFSETLEIRGILKLFKDGDLVITSLEVVINER